MANTKTFSCDNVSGASIIPATTCEKIILYENNQAGTTDLILTLGSGVAVTRPAGERIELYPGQAAYFIAGTTIGNLKTVAGTITIAQEEH